MDAHIKQALADEWHRRFELATQQVATSAGADRLGPVGRFFTICQMFSFFSGTETQYRIATGQATEDDIPVFLELTGHELGRALAEQGIDMQRLDQLQALLAQGANPDSYSK